MSSLEGSELVDRLFGVPGADGKPRVVPEPSPIMSALALAVGGRRCAADLAGESSNLNARSFSEPETIETNGSEADNNEKHHAI